MFEWVNNSRLIVSRGMTGATGNIYVGLMEYKDMSLLLHYVKEDDLFYDVGANVGAYTVLASKVKNAKTVSIEPLPNTFSKLQDNININNLNNVISLNIGLSKEKSKLYFTTDKDTMNSVATSNDKNTQEVDVDTIDNLSMEYGIPQIIKIDVEGYETYVLQGANNTLLSEKLEVLILELNGSGKKFKLYDDDIHNDLLLKGFLPYTYDPFTRELITLETYSSENTIYIKNDNVEKIKNTLKNADSFVVNNVRL